MEGFILNTKADTLSIVMKQDYGDGILVSLRKAYHHEPIFFSRVYKKRPIEIEKPKLSILLA